MSRPIVGLGARLRRPAISADTNSRPEGTELCLLANVHTGLVALRERFGVAERCVVLVKPDGFTASSPNFFTDGGDVVRLSLKKKVVGLLALAGAFLVLTASVAFADCYLVWVCIGDLCAWVLVCI